MSKNQETRSILKKSSSNIAIPDLESLAQEDLEKMTKDNTEINSFGSFSPKKNINSVKSTAKKITIDASRPESEEIIFAEASTPRTIPTTSELTKLLQSSPKQISK